MIKPGNTSGPDAAASSPWLSVLMKAKVIAPELPAGYLRRAALLARLEGVLERRLTILRAPSGFGKTTVLADLARDIRERGVIVAWISLDADDTPKLFGGYLAAALQRAGLEAAALHSQDAWSSLSTVEQMGLAFSAIELHAAPCLLVLDEIDRLPERTVQLIDLLTKRAPGNLHIAMAYRADPGFDIAPHVMNGDAIVVGAEECRFTRADIARFFQGELSRRQLAGVEERTAGWPIALLACRATREFEGAEPDPVMAAVIENYFNVRLLHDLSAEDRAALMDVAVFDGCDAAVIDEVLESDDARRRVAALPALDGLQQPIDSERNARRLHPVLKDYCLRQLSVKDPARRRSLHQRIALALVRRGDLMPAWRHAGEVGDAALFAKLVEETGVFRLWLREGMTRLTSAARFLTPEITDSFPRLELLRCLILFLSGRPGEANALLTAVIQATDNFSHDPQGSDVRALAVDGAFTHGVLVCAAGRLPPPESELPLPAETDVEADDESAKTVDAARHTLLCICCHVHGRVDESRRHGMQAQARIGEDARYGAIFLDMYIGMSEMAAGRAQEALRRYRRARDGAREFFTSDPSLRVNLDVLTLELDLERNRQEDIPQRTLGSLAKTRGAWIDIHVASVSVSAELMFEQHGESVIQLLTKAADDGRATGIRGLSYHASGLLAYYLAELERPDEAEQVWRDHGLPLDIHDLLDLDRRFWRVTEALCCARVGLLAARDEHVAAEELVGRLCGVASTRGLTRTLLRGLALSMVVAHRAGQPRRALARLVEFLRLTKKVDYIRPLVRHRGVSRSVLQQLLRDDQREDMQRSAKSILTQLDDSSVTAPPIFSARELEVLAGIRRNLQNKEIARHLGMTDEGVRYHLRNIYSKTGVRNRTDVASYAQSIDLLS